MLDSRNSAVVKCELHTVKSPFEFCLGVVDLNTKSEGNLNLTQIIELK